MMRFFLAVITVFSILIACNNDDDSGKNNDDNNIIFSISNQLINVFDNGIISRADSFIEQAKSFKIH